MKQRNYILIVAVLLLVMLGGGVGATTLQFGALDNPTGNPLGGGTGYFDIKTSGDYTVTTAAELATALGSVSSGQVIYIPGTASINLTGIYGFATKIPAGVTLASNRGSGGSAGGRIFQNRISTDSIHNSDTPNITMLMVNGNGVRITGLRIEGPDKTNLSVEDIGIKDGISNVGFQGVVVDNCEIYGWSGSGVYSTIPSNATLTAQGLADTEIGSSILNIHHNFFHHDQSDGMGYGVSIGNGSALIKGNVFSYTRHSVAAGGEPDSGYEAAYNLQLTQSTESTFDMHGYPQERTGTAGNTIRITHNTDRSNYSHSVGIRAIPVNNANISFNDFLYCEQNCQFGGFTVTGVPNAVWQTIPNGNITMTNNVIQHLFVPGSRILGV